MICRHPDGKFKAFHTFLKDIYSISLKSNKLFYGNGDSNLNVLDYNKNERITKFLNLTFECGLVLVINKPTWVTKTSPTAIDHIIANSLLYRTINTGIIKLDISDHFLIFLITETEKRVKTEGFFNTHQYWKLFFKTFNGIKKTEYLRRTFFLHTQAEFFHSFSRMSESLWALTAIIIHTKHGSTNA